MYSALSLSCACFIRVPIARQYKYSASFKIWLLCVNCTSKVTTFRMSARLVSKWQKTAVGVHRIRDPFDKLLFEIFSTFLWACSTIFDSATPLSFKAFRVERVVLPISKGRDFSHYLYMSARKSGW